MEVPRMLRFLSIERLAVIDAVEIEFEPGFNVLTGETGAGKSILVGAVGLLLGGRASPDLIRTGEETAAVQAIFERESGEELIVRREITTQGRSRAFINGALATAAALKELSGTLVELHGQREHQVLLDPESHLDLLDRFGTLDAERARVGEAFATRRAIVGALEGVRMNDREKAARVDLLSYQLGELERAALHPGEDEELLGARKVLASAEKLQRLCAESYGALYESDQAVLAGLGLVWKRVGELAALDPRFAPYLDARDGIKSQLEDLAFFLRTYVDGIDASPARLQEIEERLALLERLKRKYGPTLGDVLDRQASFKAELAALGSAEERAAELEARLRAATATYVTDARALSRRRRAAAGRFARALEEQLRELAMEGTRFDVRFNDGELPEAGWRDRGLDQAEFYLSPNPGEELRPLARIVSGGELSRVMLALKTLASSDGGARTLIFDEVDAGIGGRVADIVGRKLRSLGGEAQVLCITHLPQIAAYGATHFQIAKRVRDNRTVTSVVRLDEAGRAGELARMIGGEAISEGVRASAREMLAARATESEDIAKASAPHAAAVAQAKAKDRKRR